MGNIPNFVSVEPALFKLGFGLNLNRVRVRVMVKVRVKFRFNVQKGLGFDP